jgi:hypothetical protein
MWYSKRGNLLAQAATSPNARGRSGSIFERRIGFYLGVSAYGRCWGGIPVQQRPARDWYNFWTKHHFRFCVCRRREAAREGRAPELRGFENLA